MGNNGGEQNGNCGEWYLFSFERFNYYLFVYIISIGTDKARTVCL